MLSIIIPALNEALYIEKTLQCIFQNFSSRGDQEIIIVDEGSDDETVSIARKFPVQIITNLSLKKGRAFSLNRGAKEARGDVLLFLDADSLVPKGFDRAIMNVFKNQEISGGAFEFKLDGDGFSLRIVEAINRLRYYIFRKYYGDQGVFVRRSVFEDIGGFPTLGLMESSRLCEQILKRGKLSLIKKDMITSSRRFLDGGVYSVLGFDFKIWLLDFLGMDVQKYATNYWKFNCKKPIHTDCPAQ